MKILFYDLETTGTYVAKNGIHQISGIIEIDFHVRPKAGTEYDDKAMEIGGVTEDQIKRYPEMNLVYGQMIQMLSKYVDRYDKKDKFYLAGYNNASFDNNFIRQFFLDNGDRYFGSWFWSNSIDVMVLATDYLLESRSEMDNFKLSTVAKYLNVEVKDESLHNAFYDIYLTKSVYDIVKKTRQ